jgi:hypothetical protein
MAIKTYFEQSRRNFKIWFGMKLFFKIFIV